jgi:hypothetical protein
LKCSFRKCVDVRLFNLWEEVVSITKSLTLSDDEDELIWMHSSSGMYSFHSLYNIVNFRGVTPVYV